MVDAVESYSGTGSQLLGDGLPALRCAPLAQEDRALGTCLAALRIQRGAGSGGTAPPPVAVRIGIASVEAIIGSASEYPSPHYRAASLGAPAFLATGDAGRGSA